MSLDTDVRPLPDTQAVIKPRMDRLELMLYVLGCGTDVARAEFTGLSTRQFRRAREGRIVGSGFVANVIAALRARDRELAARNLRPAFDELFEVVIVASSTVEVDE